MSKTKTVELNEDSKTRLDELHRLQNYIFGPESGSQRVNLTSLLDMLMYYLNARNAELGSTRRLQK